MKLGKIHFSIIGGLSIAIFLLCTALKHGCLDSIARALSVSFFLYIVGWCIWDRWVWKHTLSVKFTGIPDLNGIWKGRLYSYFGGGNEKDVQITINQTASKFIVKNKTNEITSISFISMWHDEYSGRNKDLFYIFRTYPNNEFKKENPIQYGTGRIIHDKVNPDTIRLDYWTDRETIGYMDLKRIDEK